MQNQLNRIVREQYIQPTESILRRMQDTFLEIESENKAHAVKTHVDAQIRKIARERFACEAFSV